MARRKLDASDRKILRELQADGRITNVDLAARVGLSAPPCLRRVRTLEEESVIRGYNADVSAVALGYNITVFAHVGLSSQADSDLRAFMDLVNSWPLVRECHMLAGETDFILKVVARDWEAYQDFLTTQLTTAPKVTHVKSTLSIRTSKSLYGVPVDEG
jgi:DNA-binding Lrp family transcriptional regulator